MGKISHLVNIDTIEDLIVLLKTYTPRSSIVPCVIRIECIYCGLQALSGPGIELQMVKRSHQIYRALSIISPHRAQHSSGCKSFRRCLV